LREWSSFGIGKQTRRRSAEGLDMIVTTSWDDGDVLDGHVADLLDRHGVSGTFYLTRSYRPNRIPDGRIRELAMRHEIGAHTLTHPDLTRLSRAGKKNEIEGGKKWLEDVIGRPVAMFCYPFGRFDAEAKELVAQAGFKGARTTQQFVIAPPTDRFAIATTLHVYPVLLRRDNARDFGAYLVKSYAGPSPWHACFGIAVSMLRGWSHCAELLFQRSTLNTGAVFHLWGHSWEIQASGMWGQLDGFLKLISGYNYRPGTNGNSR
jgi:peptidoglycan/xylan/chitin deacetylase (PgdA/CDA1 family)